MYLYEKIRLSEDIFSYLLFIISFFILKSKTEAPKYMRGFFVYSIMAVAFAFLHTLKEYCKIIPQNIFSIINNLSIYCHYIFLGLYIISFNYEMKIRKKAFSIFWLFLFLITLSLLVKEISFGNKLAFAAANSGLAVLCIFYYYTIVNQTKSFVLVKEPSFWVVNGVFIGMIMNVPLHIARNFFIREDGYEIWAFLFALCSLAYIIMHIFFIKAYLCIIRPDKFL